jgi:transcriptional regulator with XRE-family HTH domain
VAHSKPIHECVAEHVKDAGLSISDLAEKTGWHYLRTMRLLNGDTDLSAEDMKTIAELLKRPVADLYKGVAKKSKAS